MRYSEIKTMDELESAQKDVRERLVRREFLMRESLSDVKDAFTPSNMLFSSLRGLSAFVPVEKLLLLAIRIFKRKLFK
ncbi:MAG: hypothetical protein UIV44_04995 [Bacteroidales bacterium]|nr:hypothetical protein [Bacteroidales bacterium]MCI6045864.1 hypothetical protein [Alistipes sp.]MDY4726130.1 hypothetical protein [Candidatus Cryptobacteroides sp.]MDY5198572.1 hypothetical protein [Candidatus Cryptobacteroides sp.]CCX52692.1 unknown [Alistipes sp. CAG:514]